MVFNILWISPPEWCPSCGSGKNRGVQFKYGALDQGDYRIGDTLRWGELDEGEPGRRHVVVLGQGLGCVNCGYNDDEDFRIDIKSDVLVSAEVDDGEMDYLSQGHYYWLVLER
ncbi:hypothetical protein ACFOWZ_21785 [Lentzea rhizosphaerae]|uniref:Immunity protein 22 n=1 Tax=Lentzea rhizosphaerae TaxID=2041025 RepID=A0ABV8BUP0_9PSEU